MNMRTFLIRITKEYQLQVPRDQEDILPDIEEAYLECAQTGDVVDRSYEELV